MSMVVYPACFYHDEDGYTVVFPDLNWLATDGETLPSAVEHAVDLLAGYIYMAGKEGTAVPLPSDIHDIDPVKTGRELDPDHEPKECFVNMISVDVDAYAAEYFERSVKKTLTIPYWLNKLAVERHVNFSRVLQEALIDRLIG